MARLQTVSAVIIAFVLSWFPLAAGAAELVSLNAAGTASGNGPSQNFVLSDNGRIVVFQSNATDLVAGGTSGILLFVRDLLTGVTRVASVNDPPYTGIPQFPSLSADGRFLAYQRSTCNDTFFCRTIDVFVRDLQQGTTTLVSADPGGAPAGGTLPMISADGRFVAFTSLSANLVTGDTNGMVDVFVRDLASGTTRLASVNPMGLSGNGPSSDPFLSPDGRYVAFVSEANDLAPGDGNGMSDVFVRDLFTGTTRLVSLNISGNGSGNGGSGQPSISADGRIVLFGSSASDLVPTDTNQASDIFVRDLGTGVTQLVSVNAAGTDSGRFGSSRPFLTMNGRYAAFMSGADDLIANDDNLREDVFLRDLQTSVTTLVSLNSAGTRGADGNSELPCRIPGCQKFRVASEDGRFVAFGSDAMDLVDGVSYPCFVAPCDHVYVRDLVAGVTKLADASPDGSEAGNEDISQVEIQLSADGSVAAFWHRSSNLSPQPDTNSATDIFVLGAPQLTVNDIPTLSKTGFVLLILLLAGLGARAVRRRVSG